MTDPVPPPSPAPGLFVRWTTLGKVAAAVITAAAAGVTVYDWAQKPRAGLHEDATAEEDVLLAPSLAEAENAAAHAQVRGDTTRPLQPTLAGTTYRWRVVARNTGGRRLRDVALAVPHAEYVCIRRPEQPPRCGPPVATRDLGTFDPGDSATVDAWTSGIYRPALAAAGDEPRLTYGGEDGGGVATLTVLTDYDRDVVWRLRRLNLLLPLGIVCGLLLLMHVSSRLAESARK